MSVRVAAGVLLVLFLWTHEAVNASNYGHEDPSKNLIKNWDLEQDLSGWTAERGTVTHVSGGNTGSKAAKISQRTHSDGGLVMYLDAASAGMKKNTNYYYSVFIKQLNNNNKGMFMQIRLLCQFVGASSTLVELGRLPFQRSDGTYKQLGGDFKTPNIAFTKLKCFLRVDALNVEYLMDTVALTELVRPSNWKTYLDAKIKKNRMSGVTLSANLPAGTDLSNTRIKVELIRHEFCFGMAVKGLLMLKQGDVYANYRKFVTDTFNCYGFENDIKWRQMESSKGAYKTNVVTQVMENMKQYNMTARGHAAHWNIEKNNPNWVKGQSGATLKKLIVDRVDYVTRLLKGKLKEFDVCNEYEHCHWFEQQTGDPNLLDLQFKRMHAIDPDVLLFVNDYEMVRNGRKTSAVASRAKSMLERGIPVGGIGIQSHLRQIPMDVEQLMKRVQIATSVGLPVTITEFSVHSSSETVRAQALEMAFMVYFSESLVAGIYGWGFSDQPGFSFNADMYLTKGVAMTPNAAGKVMVNLIKNKWHTSKTFTPTSRNLSENFPAFHGTYKVTVTTGGNTVYENNNFYVGKSGPSVFKFTV